MGVANRLDSNAEDLYMAVFVCDQNNGLKSFDKLTITCANGAQFKLADLPDWEINNESS